MEMKLSSENEQLVLENRPLVYYLLSQLGINPRSSDYEDIVSIGTIGLIKAAITFDSSKKISFATYAYKCINNEIFMYYRKANKYANEVSIDEPVKIYESGRELTLSDVIEHPKSNFLEEMLTQEDFIQLVSIILNYLKGKSRLVMLYQMGGWLQEDISKKLNISQSYVSRLIKNSTQEIKKVAERQIHYEKVFFVSSIEDEYKIFFSSKCVSKFYKTFLTFLRNLISAENSSDFKVKCNRKCVVILIPALPESFSFIAQIIQEIDNLSMSFVSKKSTLHENNGALEKVEPNGTKEKVNTSN